MWFLNVATLVVMAMMGLSQTARAMDGSSGCGPGWYILKENSLVSSALRATTNGVLVPVVTLGMTVGTSNCTQHKIVLKEKESLHFATMNHFELKRDLAKGNGEYLEAFATTMGCPATAQTRLNNRLRSSFERIYPDAGLQPDRTLLETYKTIFSDRELTEKCSLGRA